MPSLFKKTITGYRTPAGRKCPRQDAVMEKDRKEILKPGYTRRISKSKNYFGKYKDMDGRLQIVALCTDKAKSKDMLAKLVTDAKMGQLGLVDPYALHRKRPLICPDCQSTGEAKQGKACECREGAHLCDYRRYLAAKGNTQGHVKLAIRRVRTTLEGCKFHWISDLAPGKVMELLAYRRSLPKKQGGISSSTSNHYLRAVKGFSAWLVRDKRTGQDALKFLSMLNVETDRRHQRRSIPANEFAWLLKITRKSLRTFRGLNGYDRFMIYTFASYTGLRCSELASLTPSAFDLTAGKPMVIVEAGYSKHRRKDVLPLHPDLARLVCDYVKNKYKCTPVWPGTWAKQSSAKMLRADLEEAREAWIKEAEGEEDRKGKMESSFLLYRDATGRVFDFHALRGQFISELARRGVHPKVAQQLARHSTINLTMNVYTHLGLVDLKAAVETLPPPPGEEKDKDKDGVSSPAGGENDKDQNLPPTGTRGG